jgi:hypothetical protein
MKGARETHLHFQHVVDVLLVIVHGRQVGGIAPLVVHDELVLVDARGQHLDQREVLPGALQGLSVSQKSIFNQ